MPGHVGLAANQAFYWGLPLITEEGHHPPEIQYLKDGENGFMVPENDLAAFEERMPVPVGQRECSSEFSKNAREGDHARRFH